MTLRSSVFETDAYASSATSAKLVEQMGIEPTNLLNAIQALSQLSYCPEFVQVGILP